MNELILFFNQNVNISIREEKHMTNVFDVKDICNNNFEFRF